MDLDGCFVPDDVRVDVDDGVWLRGPGPGPVTLGLLAPFLGFAGRLVDLSFRELAGPVEAGRSLATLETVRLTAPFRTPVAGTVAELHRSLATSLRTVHDDPYGEGWLARLLVAPGAELALPSAAEARPALEAQIRERRVRCYAALPDLEVYEIGAECRAILARLDDELAGRPVGEVVLLVVDDPTAPIEMQRWSDRTGYPILEQRRADGLLHFLVRKVADPRPRRPGVP